jgi:acyl-CoA synthetase (AMP-forming)/AMP-acid ligase II
LELPLADAADEGDAGMLMHQLLLDGAMRHPDRMAFRWVDRGRQLTYGEAAEATEHMAGALAALGVGPGDRVTIFAHNGLDYLLTMLGTWRLGAIAALVNVKYAGELAGYAADHTPKVIVYTHDMAGPVAAARRAVPSVTGIVCMDGPQEGAESLPDLMAAGLAAPADPRRADAIAHLSYTSGTTGRPKGACLMHEPTVRASRCIGERLRIRAEDVSFGPTALSSSYQLVANLLPPLAVGATINVMGHWTGTTGWSAIDEAGATFLVGNPPVLENLLAESRQRGRMPGHLRFALSGGGPVPPTLKQAWRDEFAVPLVESYGQSELGGFFALGFPEIERADDRLVKIGPSLPDRETRVLASDGSAAPTGVTGEIALVDGGFMAGYWGMPDKTAEATRKGILWSGDLGMMDRDGFITMRGRRSELVHVAGHDWFPRDIEEALARQPGIRLAALVGVSDGSLGMRPIAFAVPASGVTPDSEALKATLRAEVPFDLDPLEIRFVDALPLTPTGKIAKADLAASVAS